MKLWTPTRRRLLTGGASLIAAPYVARAGTISLLGAGKISSGGGAYVGPGDLASGAKMWAGLRAYSNATIGANAVRLIRASDSTQQDFVTVAGGGLDITSINTFLASTTGKIVTLYDQTGNGFPLTTAANKPDFILTGIGTGPAYDSQFVTASADQFLLTSFGATLPQPYTVSCVARTTSSAASDLFGDAATIAGVFFFASGKLLSYAGTNANTTAATFTNNTPYALQFLFNGASSTINVNGSNSPLANSPGTNVFPASGFNIGFNNFFANFDGNIPEFGVWPSDITGSGIGANQKTYWGF